MLFKLLFVFSVFAGIFNDYIVKVYLGNLDIFIYLFVLNLVSFILLACMFFVIGRYNLLNFYKKRSYLFMFKKFIQFVSYNILVLFMDCEFFGVSFVPLIILVNLVFLFTHMVTLLFKARVISFSYMTVIRSIISTGGLFLILNEFNDSNMIQITSGYYSIPIGDFLYTSSRTSSIWVLSALGILVLLILTKDILSENFDFMNYDIFQFNGFFAFVIMMIGLAAYVYKRFGLLKSLILVVSCGSLMLLQGNDVLTHTVALNVNLLFYIVSVSSILGFLYTKSRDIGLVNYVIIGFNVFVLIVYKAKIFAIIGSIFLSIADIIIRNYAKDIKSELMGYSLTFMAVSLPILFIKYDYNILQLFMINTSYFPIVDVNWAMLWLTALTSLIIQFAVVVCFSRNSLNTYLPFRYIDLFVTSIMERRYDLSIIPVLSSLLFGYFL
jgi:hypothetical protein